MSSYHVLVPAVKVLCWHRHGKPTHTQMFRLIDPALLSPGGCGMCGWLNGKILLLPSPTVFIQLHESRYWIAHACMREAVHQISNLQCVSLQPLWDFFFKHKANILFGPLSPLALPVQVQCLNSLKDILISLTFPIFRTGLFAMTPITISSQFYFGSQTVLMETV